MDTDGVAAPGRESEREPAWSKSMDSTRTYEHGMALEMILQDDLALSCVNSTRRLAEASAIRRCNKQEGEVSWDMSRTSNDLPALWPEDRLDQEVSGSYVVEGSNKRPSSPPRQQRGECRRPSMTCLRWTDNSGGSENRGTITEMLKGKGRPACPMKAGLRRWLTLRKARVHSPLRYSIGCCSENEAGQGQWRGECAWQ